jgi:hypothetical protein
VNGSGVGGGGGRDRIETALELGEGLEEGRGGNFDAEFSEEVDDRSLVVDYVFVEFGLLFRVVGTQGFETDFVLAFGKVREDFN